MQYRVKQRMSEINTYIYESGFVSVNQIMEHFQMSKSTTNRYLNILEQNKQIRRLHGGVMPYTQDNVSNDFHVSQKNLEAKSIIGKYAASLVKDNDVILVSTGITCFELFKNLTAKNITVFTNSVPCLAYHNPCISKMYSLGGEVYNNDVIVGSLTIENLIKIYPNKIFFSASAINDKYEIQCSHDIERQFVETLLNMNAQKIFLSDSSKLQNRSSFNINNSMSRIDVFITDLKIAENDINNIQSHGTRVITV